jgi:ABC-type sugar transport system ATPase subunit
MTLVNDRVMRDGGSSRSTCRNGYQARRSLFVGTFISSPSMNLVEAILDGTMFLRQFRAWIASRPEHGVDRVCSSPRSVQR